MTSRVDVWEPGAKVAVVQQIPHQGQVWTSRVVGEVVRCEQRKTGSWYAHAKDDKLWLDRMTLRKDDGEIIMFNLDRFTHVERLAQPKPSEPAPAKE
ncbi:MAG: hypothetical protein IT440_08735 [Phycisphaeraceae bacterium]|nr:hypothetical protein [Phycisphaeraceae bacterium]